MKARVQRTPLPLMAAIAALAACDTGDNICGDGFRPSIEGQRCVPMESGDRDVRSDDPEGTKDPRPAGGQDAAGKQPTQEDAGKRDAAIEREGDAGTTGGLDGGDAQTPRAGMQDAGERDAAGPQLDAQTIDAQLDAGDVDTGVDAGQADASTVPPDAAFDAGDPDAAVSDFCPEDDAARWAAMHLSGSLVVSIGTCIDELACTPLDCPLDACMRDMAEVQACDACVADEVACVFNECFDACAPGGTDAACLACACEAGCVTLFEQCSGREVDACNACEPAVRYCHGMHPWPALMVPILHPLLGG